MASFGDTNIFQDTWTGIRHLFGQYTPEEKQAQIDRDKQVQDSIKKNQDANGGVYNPLTPVVGSFGGLQSDLEWLIIILGGLLAYAFIFKK
jgi:hypothetical protein